MKLMKGSRVIVALDFPEASRVLSLVDQFEPADCRLKVGSELFAAAGPRLVEQLRARGFEIFLDLKFHDIPNTVQRACAVARDLGVWMLTVHAAGGRRMVEAAADALGGGSTPPLLVAVTVLTSLEDRDLADIGLRENALAWVDRLGRLAVEAGADGLVCSAREVGGLRASLGPAKVLVTPGIRPAGFAPGDQRRVLTPGEAVRAGADLLVVGRPVAQSDDPRSTLLAICSDISDAAP
jgi:orotidine-5'-phosphate decarboxylase